MLVAVTPATAFAAVADSFEPDDTYATASPIVVDAAAQQHTIFPEGDEDWVSFAVNAGQTYTIETASGTPAEDVDTVLYLYDSDGTTQIDSDDDDGTAPTRSSSTRPTRTRRSTRRSWATTATPPAPTP